MIGVERNQNLSFLTISYSRTEILVNELSDILH